MESSEYDLVLKVQEQHWWWLSRQRMIERLIKRYCPVKASLKIADVGSGFGANVNMLLRYGEVTALEPNEDAVTHVNLKWGGGGRVKAIKWEAPEPVDDQFDLILLADTLEHIHDDTQAVDWIWQHLKPGRFAIATVPAHEFLWTEMDDVVHHFRRYRYHTLKNLFGDRFQIVFISYYNLFLFPVKLLFVGFARTLRGLFPQRPKRSYNDTPPLILNNVLKAVAYSESYLIPRLELPFGVSLVIVVQR